MYGDKCYLNIQRGVFRQHGAIFVQTTDGDYIMLCKTEARQLAAKLLELAEVGE